MRIQRYYSAYRVASCLAFLAAITVLAAPAPAETPQIESTIGPPSLSVQPQIDAGFRLLYELKFSEARAVFVEWENRHPGEPLGVAAESASYLFQEFDRQGVLTSDFFLDDKRFLGGIKGETDPQMASAFNASIKRTQDLAEARLKSNPSDPDALLAQTMAAGMLADYSSLIERKQVESLRLTREADSTAKSLLAVDPNALDAYVALGTSNYVLGCLSPMKRFFVRLDGLHGDKTLGMQQVAMAAARGHYLRPFAKLMLGLAAMREKQWGLARTEMEELHTEFPTNPRFSRELAKLKDSSDTAKAR